MRNREIALSPLLAVLVFQLSCGGNVPAAAMRGESKNETTRAPRARHDALSGEAPRWDLLEPRPDDVVPPMKYSTGVGDDGAATIQVPIWSPPGRNGIEPHLSLSYSSRSGQGLAGAGFQLAGLSSIERCWKTPASDGQFSTTETPDEFCLSGRRLIRDPSSDDMFPEGDPGTRVRAFPSSASPLHFVAEAADGTRTSFGVRAEEENSKATVRANTTILTQSETGSDRIIATSGTPLIVAWFVDRVEDRWGNFMLVDYERFVGGGIPQTVEVRPLMISYTGNNKLFPVTRKVEFAYQSASKPRTRRVSRLPVVSSSRLSEIKVSAEDRLSFDDVRPTDMKVLRRYSLTYLPPGPRNLDRLAQITECFAKSTATGEACATPLQFSWLGTDSPRVPTFTTRESISATGFDFPMPVASQEFKLLFDILDAAIGDFNGDGFDDYLFRIPEPLIQRGQTADSRPQVIATASYRLSLGSAGGLTDPIVVSLPASSGSDNALSPRVIDLDGDGSDDVVLAKVQLNANSNSPPYTPDEIMDWDAFSWNGTTFVAKGIGEVLSASTRIVHTPARSPNLFFGDLDGDGAIDLLSLDGLVNQPGPAGGMRVRKGSRSAPFSLASGVTVPLAAGLFVPDAKEEKHLLDLDGNGSSEFVARPPGDSSVLSDGFEPAFRAYPLVAGAFAGRLTRLWAQDLTHSLAAATARQLPGCSSASNRLFLNRYFMDVDGDGLRDSVSLPAEFADTCATVRHWDGSVFTSLNLGGIFLAPGGQKLPFSTFEFSPHSRSIGPTVFSEIGRDWPDLHAGDVKVLEDRNRSSTRTVDNGVRILDLDGDGREDIVLVGDRVLDLGLGTLPRNVTAFLANGTGFDEPIEIPISTARSLGREFADESASVSLRRGSGPRSARFGDFNGDGLVDLALVAWEAGPGAHGRIVTHTQDPRTPDTIFSVSGGPQTPAATFTLSFLGPQLANRLPATSCGPLQRCPKRFGWVVSRFAQEANAFDTAVSELLQTDYRYGTPVVDTRGRGFLGFATREVETDGLIERTTKGLATRFPVRPATGPDVPYVYSGLVTSERTVASVVKTTGTLARTFQSGKAGLSPATLVQTTVVREGPTQVQTRNIRSTSSYDAYGTAVSSLTEWMDPSDVVISSSMVELAGSNAVDDDLWLVNRYEKLLNTSSELVESVVRTEVRTTGLEYEATSSEVKVSTAQPDEGDEDVGRNGVKLKTTYVRDPKTGNVTQIESTNSLSTRSVAFEFDSLDQQFPTTSTNSLGHAEQFYAHMGLGLRFASDDANGVRQRSGFDAFLRPRIAASGVLASDDVSQGGATYDFSYSKNRIQNGPGPFAYTRAYWYCVSSTSGGNQCNLVDPAGRTTEQAWSDYDGTTSQTLNYDRFGRLVAQSLPWQDIRKTKVFVTRDFDRLGRILTQERPGESLTATRLKQTWTYPPGKQRHVDERNVVTVKTADAKGRLIQDSTFEPTSSREVAIQHQYTTFDQLEKLTHPPLNVPMTPAPTALVTSMEYDILGRVTKLTDPDTGVEERLFSAFGELKQTTDANGGVTVLTRDALGRLSVIDTAPNQPYRVGRHNTFEWDTALNGVGVLGSATSTDGVTTTFTYDQFGREDSSTWRMGGQDYSFARSYDSAGRVQSIQYPEPAGASPFRLEFEYAANGVVRTVYDGAASPSAPKPILWHGISMHANGAIEEQQFGTTTRDVRRFDTGHNLRYLESKNVQSNTMLQRLSYQWESGFIASKTDLSVQSTETYTHDFLGRLSSWKVEQNCTTSQWNYSYDDLGNLRKRELVGNSGADIVSEFTLPGGGTDHPHAVKRSTVAGVAQSYKYLPGGQASSAKGLSIEWTPFGLPSLVSDSWASTAYSYDAFNSRFRTVETGGAGTRDVVAVAGLFEQESTANGSLFTYNIPGPEGVLGQIRKSSSSPTEARFFHVDHLGTPDTISNQTGNLVERVKFEPFGDRRHAWALSQPMSDSLVLTSSAGFTGHQNADRFKLTDMRGRVYDSAIGGFLSPDPLAHVGVTGLSRTAYVRNSPVMRLDPSGFDDAPVQPYSGLPTVVTEGRLPRQSQAQNFTGEAGAIPVSNDQQSAIRTGDDRLASEHVLESVGVGAGALGSGLLFGLGVTVAIGSLPFTLTASLVVLGVSFLAYQLATGGAGRFQAAAVRAALRIRDGKVTIGDVREGMFGIGALIGGGVGTSHLATTAVTGASEIVLTQAEMPVLQVEETQGVATIYDYGKHVSIEVSVGGKVLHTEQVVLAKRMTTIAEVEAAAPVVRSVEVQLPNGQGALDYQRSVVGTDTKVYNVSTNSCVTHCGNVLRAGGVEGVPATTREIIRWLQETR